MTQAASFTSPCFWASCLLAPALNFAASPAGAEEFASVYTSLDLARCRDTTPPVGNPKANEPARQIADKEALSFRCKQDKAKSYGKGPN